MGVWLPRTDNIARSTEDCLSDVIWNHSKSSVFDTNDVIFLPAVSSVRTCHYQQTIRFPRACARKQKQTIMIVMVTHVSKSTFCPQP